MTTCEHATIDLGRLWDYCEDCGGVREAARPGVPPGAWHSCEACRL